MKGMHTTPITLLERLRAAGDQQAWERFVALYTPLLYYWARLHQGQLQEGMDYQALRPTIAICAAG